MSETIKQLSQDLINRANYNSFNGTRGDTSNSCYKDYANKIISWPIAESKKQTLLEKLHEKYSEIMKYEAQHISVMVAGPSKYNARKLDKSDLILRLSSELVEWFNVLEKKVNEGTREDNTIERVVKLIKFSDETDGLDPTQHLAGLASIDNVKFIELYEKLRDKYKWRKNSTIAKLYEMSINGNIQEVKKEIAFEDDNFTAYKYGDRAYIKFILKPQRQLMVALKSRGWWWNAGKSSWSTYQDKADWEWVMSISKRYAKYV